MESNEFTLRVVANLKSNTVLKWRVEIGPSHGDVKPTRRGVGWRHVGNRAEQRRRQRLVSTDSPQRLAGNGCALLFRGEELLLATRASFDRVKMSMRYARNTTAPCGGLLPGYQFVRISVTIAERRLQASQSAL